MPREKKHPELLALKGKIREENTTYLELAKKIGMDPSTFSNKINGYTAFTTDEVHLIVEKLNINEENIIRYFFPEMLRNERKRRDE